MISRFYDNFVEKRKTAKKIKNPIDKREAGWYNIQAVTESGWEKAWGDRENGPWKLNNKSKKYKASKDEENTILSILKRKL